jgi:hypothetical protein
LSQIDRARRIAATMSSDGWGDVVEMLNTQAQESADTLLDLMGRKPDTLTGKTAIKLASRRAALLDFMESLTDEVKLLASQKESK